MLRRAILAVLTFAAATNAFAADVLVSLSPLTAARPGERASMAASVRNRTPDMPASVRMVVTFDPALVVEQDQSWRLPAECTATSGRIECTWGSLAHETPFARFLLRLPVAPAGREYVVNAEVTSTPADTTPLDNTATTKIQVIGQHIVSNTNDAGPGSLRAAIEAANDWCTQERPCEITFDFVPRDAIAVIEPLSPLPPLTACGVKAGGPVPFGGARPPVRVEIDGRRLSSGQGLELRSACTHPFVELTGMRIINFPGDGIAVTAPNVYILNGFEVLRNRGRGIAVLANAPRFEINHSLIAENARSGIAMFESNLRVQQSNIGIGWDGEDRANGASGIFIAPTGRSLTIRRSKIGYHPHYGVALAGRGDVDIDAETVIARNIADLDWFLDGPVLRTDLPKTPRIVSAVYEPAINSTRIAVSLQEEPLPITAVRFYVSDRITIFGTAHLERHIGGAAPAGETFTIVLPATGDIRGQYLSAVVARLFHSGFPDSPPPEMRWISEASAAVKVD